jgi:hypothetical protein
MTKEEQAFWDAVFLACVPIWHLPTISTAGLAIAPWCELIANEALAKRRNAQATLSTSA